MTSIGDDVFSWCTSLKLVAIESPTIAKNVTSSSSYGYLTNYAQTAVLPVNITEVGSYVTSKFPYTAVIQNGDAVKLYSKHSHAPDATTWVTNENGVSCSACGFYRLHDMRPATCEAPAFCSRCDHTVGQILGYEDLVSEWETGSLKARLFADKKNEGKYVLHISGNGEMENYTTTGMPWYAYMGAIRELLIHEGVTAIGENALRNATALEKVTLAESVDKIGASSFRGCTALSDLSAFARVKTVEKYAFMGCSSLRAVTVGENATMENIGTYAFSGCDNLSLVVVKNPTVAMAIASTDSYGKLFAMATTISVPESITELHSFVIGSFTKVDTLMQDGERYTVYAKHSHAENAEAWEEIEGGKACTICGITVIEKKPASDFAVGDVNGDGTVNIVDVTACVSAASGTALDPARYPGNADINNDGTVNVVDITLIVSLASGK